MSKLIPPLNPTKIDAAKPKDNSYQLHDGGGLILEIRPSKKKVWLYKYKHATTKKDVRLTLGDYPALSLQAARDKRTQFEKWRQSCIDPREQLNLDNTQQTNAHSLENIVREWLPEYAKRNGIIEDTEHKKLRKFENHLFPLIGDMPINTIKTKHLENALTAIYQNAPVVAQRLRGDLAHVFSYAKTNEYIESNCMHDLGKDILPPHKVKHRPALHLNRLPELLQRIESDTGHPITKLCTLLTLHIFIRSSEVRFARWSEINFETQEWIVPATREAVEGVRHSGRGAKMKTPHLVPLSPQAIEILKQVYKHSGHGENVFPNDQDTKKFISENTVNDALQRMGYDTGAEVCGHGFRTMACSALGESRKFSKDAVEKQMSHQERDDTRAAYTHAAEYLDERKEMMMWWSDYLGANKCEHTAPRHFDWLSPLETSSNVIQFRRTRAI